MPDRSVRALNEAGRIWDDPSEGMLQELVDGLAESGSYVRVERRSDSTGQTYGQVTLTRDGSVRVEFRFGGPEHHYKSIVSDRRLAHEALSGWALGVPGWDERLTWKPLKPKPSARASRARPVPRKGARPGSPRARTKASGRSAEDWACDPGYAQIGCPVAVLSSLVGILVAVLIQLLTGFAEVAWEPIWQGVLAGLILAMIAMVVATSIPSRRTGEAVLMVSVAVLPGVATSAAVLFLAGMRE